MSKYKFISYHSKNWCDMIYQWICSCESKDTWCSNLPKTTGIMFHLRMIWKSNVFFETFWSIKQIVRTSVEIFCVMSLWILWCNRISSMEYFLISDHLIWMEGWFRETKTIMVFIFLTRTRFLLEERSMIFRKETRVSADIPKSTYGLVHHIWSEKFLPKIYYDGQIDLNVNIKFFPIKNRNCKLIINTIVSERKNCFFLSFSAFGFQKKHFSD